MSSCLHRVPPARVALGLGQSPDAAFCRGGSLSHLLACTPSLAFCPAHRQRAVAGVDLLLITSFVPNQGSFKSAGFVLCTCVTSRVQTVPVRLLSVPPRSCVWILHPRCSGRAEQLCRSLLSPRWPGTPAVPVTGL